MKSISGKDYTGIKPQVLDKRLKLITDLLMHMHKSPIDQNVPAEVLKKIQFRMDQVPGEILDDSKIRAGSRKKRQFQLSPDKNFTDQDFEAIATDFEISVRDAQEMIQLYQNCFDGRGNFLRAAFEKNVPG
jgi:hypothetical protein